MKAAPIPNPKSFLDIFFFMIRLVSSLKYVPYLVSVLEYLTLVIIGLRTVNLLVLGGVHVLYDDE